MRSTRHVVAGAAVVIVAFASLIGPAAAHERTITQVFATVWEDGSINTQAWLNPETHAGTMKTTLKKKNAAGDWIKIARKKATYQVGWGYMVTFDAVPGKKKCKAVAKFTSRNHPKLSKASPVFDC